ncbi:helix-turn-helix domain-containing protein [Chryseobacterium aquaticum]|nr:helix-turn-helix transcriptional regulator [Chryseobacterium aquaticum]
MILGHKIKNIRELKNLTQEFVAEKLDISQSA